MSRRYDAVLFDLLTALLDSASLWNAVAGGEDAGRAWRAAYLKITYGAGAYRPYEDLVRDAADEVGLSPRVAEDLAARYGELQPWPGVTDALTRLGDAGVRLGVVTNCSEALGRIAVAKVGAGFEVVVTAERAGYYKPDPRPYQLALSELGLARDRCLFVAGSGYDLFGTAKVGLATYWHNRMGLQAPDGAPRALVSRGDLTSLVEMVLG